jgi:hypothetical protein
VSKTSQVRVKCPECGNIFLPSLKEKQSRAGKASRRKGAGFENKKAKELAAWWNQGKTNYEFKRTPMSGGSALKEGFDMAGDICTNAKDFMWHLELKNVPSGFTGLHNFLSEKAKVWKWLEQAIDECPDHREPMLIFNRFDMPTFCAAPYTAHNHIIDRLERAMVPYYNFWDPNVGQAVVIWPYKDMLESDPELWKL